jgi:hypothetical protein
MRAGAWGGDSPGGQDDVPETAVAPKRGERVSCRVADRLAYTVASGRWYGSKAAR